MSNEEVKLVPPLFFFPLVISDDRQNSHSPHGAFTAWA